MATNRKLTYVDLQNSEFINFSGLAPGTETGFNQLVDFLSNGRNRQRTQETSIGRSLFVKAEDPAFIREMNMKVLGLTHFSLSVICRDLYKTIFTDDITFRWTTQEFVPQLMTDVPALGTSRAPEIKTKSYESKGKRTGQHFEIEGDRYYTKSGQRDVNLHMAYWAKCLADTIGSLAWAKLVEPQPERRTPMNLRSRIAYDDFLYAEKQNYAAAIKDPKGFMVTFQRTCAQMRAQCGMEPTLMFMPREKVALITNGTSLTEFSSGGPKANKMLFSTGYLTNIDGVQLYDVPSFDINPAREQIGPLTTEVRHASWHLAQFEDTPGPLYGKSIDKLYDLNSDRWVKLCDRKEMMKNSNRFTYDAEGNLIGLNHEVISQLNWNYDTVSDDPFLGLWKERCDASNSKFLAVVPDITVIERGVFEKEIEMWVEKKTDVLLIAPFDGYRMQGELYAAGTNKSDEDDMSFGVMALSTPIITYSSDGATQKFRFDMTAWMGPHIFDTSRIIVRQNAHYDGILGGSSVTYIDGSESKKLFDNNFIDSNVNRKSIYVLLVTKDYKDYGVDYLDIQGKGRYDQSTANAKGTYPCWEYYQIANNWDSIDDDTCELYRPAIAKIAYRREFNRLNKDRSKYEYEPGDGPHGKDVGIGSKAVRRFGTQMTKITTNTGVD